MRHKVSPCLLHGAAEEHQVECEGLLQVLTVRPLPLLLHRAQLADVKPRAVVSQPRAAVGERRGRGKVVCLELLRGCFDKIRYAVIHLDACVDGVIC